MKSDNQLHQVNPRQFENELKELQYKEYIESTDSQQSALMRTFRVVVKI